MLPFFIGGILRLVFLGQLVSGQTLLSVFKGTEISICLALMCLLVAHSLLNHNEVLNTEEKSLELKDNVHGLYIMGLFFLIVFAVTVILETLVDTQLLQYSNTLIGAQIFTYCIAPLFLYHLFKIQQTFRLTVTTS